MEAGFRPSANNNYSSRPDTDKADTASEVIAQHRDSTGNVNVGSLISALKSNKESTAGLSGLIEQVGAELEKVAHPFDMARFRDEFKSELQIKDSLTYQGKPILVGSAIDRTQQTKQYADDALFSYRNTQGVVEITNEFAFIEPPQPQPSTTETPTASNSAGAPACNNPSLKLATVELDASLGKGKKNNLSGPSVKIPIHDGKTKSDARFDIGEKGEFKGATIQLTGYAENVVDEGSIHINEKGAYVTISGASGNSGLGLGSIENDSNTANGTFNAIETEFEVKTELHVDTRTQWLIGTKSTAEVKLNLLELNGEKKHTINLPTKDINITLSGEIQAGPAIKAEVMTGALAEKKPVNVEGSLFRGKVKLDIEMQNKNCE